LKNFCVDKTLQQRLGIEFPVVVTGSGPHHKGMVARRILAFDFEVTTIIFRNHLSIKSVWAKRINYFREKSLDFFVQLVNDAVGGIGGIYLPKTRVGKDRCHLLILHKTPHDVAENIGSVAAISIASATGIGEEILGMVFDHKTNNLVVATNNRGEYFSLVQHRKLNIK